MRRKTVAKLSDIEGKSAGLLEEAQKKLSPRKNKKRAASSSMSTKHAKGQDSTGGVLSKSKSQKQTSDVPPPKTGYKKRSDYKKSQSRSKSKSPVVNDRIKKDITIGSDFCQYKFEGTKRTSGNLMNSTQNLLKIDLQKEETQRTD